MFTEAQIYENLKLSLSKAEAALNLGNYPIGAVIVDAENNQLCVEMNQCASHSDITAHAEIVALRSLGNKINKYTQGDHFLFTSLEPCFGCSFFIARSNIRRVYSALKDPHKGGMGDLKQQDQFYNFFSDIEIINGPFKDLAQKSKELMQKYFLSISNIEAAKFYGYLAG